MPDFFVCTDGPMGGATIVFTAYSYEACWEWIDQQDPNKSFYVYERVGYAE